MPESRQKQVVKRFYHDMWNGADKRLIGEIFHADFTYRAPVGPVLTGFEQFEGYVDQVLSSVSGFSCEILDMVEEDNKVAARMLFSGTHTSPMFGIEATGKYLEWAGSAHFTFTGEKISYLWVTGEIHQLLARITDSGVVQG